MRKRIVLCLVLASVLLLGGCGQANTGTDISQHNENIQADASNSSSEFKENIDEGTTLDDSSEQGAINDEGTVMTDDTDILVVYFSRTGEQYGVGVIDKGNTAIVADMIAEQLSADTFEILPQEDYYPYTYDELTDIAKKELNDNARPAYAGEVPDLSRYNTIFIGAPVWWGDWPMICYTFFEENADGLAGKTLIPFSTHAGSGLSGFDSKLADACPDSTVGKGLAVKGTDAQNDQDAVRQSVNSWLSELGY